MVSQAAKEEGHSKVVKLLKKALKVASGSSVTLKEP